MPERRYIEELEFDLPSALLAELKALLDQMPQGSLTDTSIDDRFYNAQGVYQLFLDGSLVYIGKTDADAGLGARLTRHARKIRSRLRLDPSRVTFKAVRVYVFTAMDLEDLLIKDFKKDNDDKSPNWNHSGFGSNDPGRERDTSQRKDGHFDRLYPIDMSITAEIEGAQDPLPVANILQQMKGALAYTVRFHRRGGGRSRPHADLETTTLQLKSATDTVESILRQVAGALGASWQVTALPGYVIIYKEKKRYPDSRILAPLP